MSEHEKENVDGKPLEPAVPLNAMYTVEDLQPIFEGLAISSDPGKVRVFLEEITKDTANRLRARDASARELPGQIRGCYAPSDILPMFEKAGLEVTMQTALIFLDCLDCVTKPQGWSSSQCYRVYPAEQEINQA